MKVRSFSLKPFILIFFFLLLIFSVVMTSPDLRNFFYRVTKLDRESGPGRKESTSELYTANKQIVNRVSIKIDSQEEARPNLPTVTADKIVERQESPYRMAGPVASASVNGTTHAPANLAEKRISRETNGSPRKFFYRLHIGSFKNIAHARARAEQLTTKGHDAWWEEVTIPEKGDWYRVYVGKQADKAEALDLGRKLKADGTIEYFSVHKKNDQRKP